MSADPIGDIVPSGGAEKALNPGRRGVRRPGNQKSRLVSGHVDAYGPTAVGGRDEVHDVAKRRLVAYRQRLTFRNFRELFCYPGHAFFGEGQRSPRFSRARRNGDGFAILRVDTDQDPTRVRIDLQPDWTGLSVCGLKNDKVLMLD